MPHIYKITNLINNKLYIGKTHLPNIQQRFQQHISDAKKSHREHRPLYDAINKYGAENFKIELIETVGSDREACERENYWITHFRTYLGFADCNGYNATLGGDGKTYINREKIKETLLNFPDKTSEQIAKICNCCSDTVREIAKENSIHLKTSQELTREKLKKEILQIDIKTGNILNKFESIQDACIYLKDTYDIKCKCNSMRAYISQVARNIKKQAFGYRWEYIDKENNQEKEEK